MIPVINSIPQFSFSVKQIFLLKKLPKAGYRFHTFPVESFPHLCGSFLCWLCSRQCAPARRFLSQRLFRSFFANTKTPRNIAIPGRTHLIYDPRYHPPCKYHSTALITFQTNPLILTSQTLNARNVLPYCFVQTVCSRVFPIVFFA